MDSAARALLASGDPVAALKALQQQVRAQAADVRLRVFLAQLLCVLGQWKRALDQLKVCAELDAGTLAMVNTCNAAIQCEQVREAVFEGRVLPHVFGPPATWLAELAQALQLDAQGRPDAAAGLRAAAFDAAPSSRGRLALAGQDGGPDGGPDGGQVGGQVGGQAYEQDFEWLADADSRIGPVLEIIINGRYGWLPLAHCASLTVEPVVDLRDLVWAPAQLEFANGAQTVALLPVRYCPSPLADGGALALSRRTEWLPLAGAAFRGIGQRMLATDAAEFGLLELRRLSISGQS